MKLAIAVTTAPRETPTLGRSLDSLRNAGFADTVHVFAEPSSLTRDFSAAGHVQIHQHRELTGCFGNWLHAASWLVKEKDATHILMCEDDVEYCRSSREKLFDGLSSLLDIGYVSLYTPIHNVKVARNPLNSGWVALNLGRRSWGSLAYVFSKQVLTDVIRRADWRLQKGRDAHVSSYITQLGLNCWFHVPSLARHIGETSTVGHAIRRDSEALGYHPDY